MPGVPVLLHIGRLLRIDTGFQLGLQVTGDTMAMPMVPLAVHLQALKMLSVGVVSGISAAKFDFSQTMVPLAFDAIFSPPKGLMPLADIGLSFGFPGFFTPGMDGDKLHSDQWTMSLFGTFYLDI
jgi:hypothetical protein